MTTLDKLNDKCTFTGTHFTGWVKPVSVDQKSNTMTVRCVYKGSEWEETWNLQHTIWGFEQKEYKFLD